MSNNNVNAYDEIIPNLYLGGVKALVNTSNTSPKFSLIINLIKQTYMSDNTVPDCKKYIRLPVNDSPDECDKLLSLIYETQVLEHIHASLQENEPVLVHCFMGIQRSASLVACYLIKYHSKGARGAEALAIKYNNMTPTESIIYIKTKRPIAFFGGANFANMIEKFYENEREK